MLEEFALRRLVRTLVGDGRIKLTDWNNKTIWHEGPRTHADREWLEITVHDAEVVRRMAVRPHLASLVFGEAYVKGQLTFGTDDTGNDQRQLQLLFTLLAANATRRLPQRGQASNKKEDQQPNISHHYDVGYTASADSPSQEQRYYDLLLGRTRLYSCAYLREDGMTLDEAQDAKVAHLLGKLDLRDGMTLLDVGCGSGYLSVMAAKLCRERDMKVTVTGITISREQLAFARDLAQREGVADLVKFELMNYQELPAKLKNVRFDRIVSVGMFEHVGAKDYDLFFRLLSDALVPGGVLVLHTITQRLARPISPFVSKEIFPGGELPTLAQIYEASYKTDLWEEHAEDLCQHYAWTLIEWAKRHLEHQSKIIALMGEEKGEKFWRTRWLWLWASWAGFHLGDLGLRQMRFKKGKASEPETNAYMYAESYAA